MANLSSCELLEATWGTEKDALRLGCEVNTRKWAYAWIEERLAQVCGTNFVDVCADLGGGGVHSHFSDRLSCYAYETLIIDKIGVPDEVRHNIKQVVIDFEKGMSAVADNSIDIFVSSSAIEHLSAEGQKTIFREITRTLKPGGYFIGTISYICGLTAEVLDILAEDPAFESIGSPVKAVFDFNAVSSTLHYIAEDIDQKTLPGANGFLEEALYADKSLLWNHIGSYGDCVCKKETDELNLRFYELGIVLQKEVPAKLESHAPSEALPPPTLNISGKDLQAQWMASTPLVYDDLITSAKLDKLEGEHFFLPYFNLKQAEKKPAYILNLALSFPETRENCRYHCMIQDDNFACLCSFVCDYTGNTDFERTIRIPCFVNKVRLVLEPLATGSQILPNALRLSSTWPVAISPEWNEVRVSLPRPAPLWERALRKAKRWLSSS